MAEENPSDITDRNSVSSSISDMSRNDHNSSKVEIHCDIDVKIGTTVHIEAVPSLSPFEITWQRFVAEGFSSLSENQVSLKEQLQRAEIKLNLYVQRSFAQVTPKCSIQDKIPVISANQRMKKMMLTQSGIINVEISVLYFNGKLWVKFYRTDSAAEQYFFYHAVVELQVESFDEQTLLEQRKSSFFDLMLPSPNLMDMQCLGPLGFQAIEEKRCLLLFKISPVRFKLELAAESISVSDDKVGAENSPFCGPLNQPSNNPNGEDDDVSNLQKEEKIDNPSNQGYFDKLLTCLDGDLSLSDASSDQASIHTDALDGAPFLDDEMCIDVTTVDNDAAMPLSETVLAEHKEMEGQVFEPITSYDDFAGLLNDPDRTAFLGYSQSVENSRAASINEDANNENTE